MRVLAATMFLLPATSFAMPVPREIEGRYKALLTSYRARDFIRFKSFFSRDYQAVDPKGNASNYDAFVTGFDESVKGATKITAQERFSGATRSGETIMVHCDFTSTITTPKGSNDVHEVCVDFWRKVGGKWLLVKTVDSLFTLTPSK